MRGPLLSLWLVATLGLAGLARAGTPPEPSARPPARIVLAFPNQGPSAATAAGSTTARYSASGYVEGQRAHAIAQSVARQYALKKVASWPVRALAVHCVVYEVPAGQDVAALLARLRQDTRVTLAQPLQDFHVLAAGAPSRNAPHNL